MTRMVQIVVVEGNLEIHVARKLLTSLGVLADGVVPMNKRGSQAF